MPVKISLEDGLDHCSFVPLAVVGYCLTRSGLLQPLWSDLHLDLKCCQHSPPAKLQDALMTILAGCRSLHQLNTRLRPELMLAQAWGRTALADQSTVARTLEALASEHLEQLRAGHLTLLRRHSQLRHHDWQRGLMLDADATSLLASKHAEGSEKGWVSGKKTSIVGTCCASRSPDTTKVCCR